MNSVLQPIAHTHRGIAIVDAQIPRLRAVGGIVFPTDRVHTNHVDALRAAQIAAHRAGEAATEITP